MGSWHWEKGQQVLSGQHQCPPKVGQVRETSQQRTPGNLVLRDKEKHAGQSLLEERVLPIRGNSLCLAVEV